VNPLVSPSQPSLNELEEACLAAGFLSMGVAIGMLVAGLIIGYLIGARKMLRDWLRKLATPKPDKDDKDDKGADGDDGENAADDEEAAGQLDDLLSGFFDSNFLSGHDDHPDLEFNPIVMYQVKKAKDALREQKTIEALLAAKELPPDHLDTMGAAERAKFIAELKAELSSSGVKAISNVGSVAGVSRKYGSALNSTYILHQHGARFHPGQKGGKAKDSEGEDAKKAQEVRDRIKIIDNHLSTMEGISTVHELKATKRAAGSNGLIKNALEKAKDTVVHRAFAGSDEARMSSMVKYAHLGRARVAPPLDHAIAASGIANSRKGAAGVRRASLGRAKEPGEGGNADEGGGEKEALES